MYDQNLEVYFETLILILYQDLKFRTYTWSLYLELGPGVPI